MDGYKVNLSEKDGLRIVELIDSEYEAKASLIPGIGNNLISFACRGIQVIVPPSDMQAFITHTGNHTMYGTPLLFPPNRVKAGRFQWNGNEYKLPLNEPPHYHLHGDIARRPWQIIESGAADELGAYVTCSFDFTDHPDILTYFPHELLFQVTFTLVRGQLLMDIAIENRGAVQAPFAFGLHPYFAVPAESGKDSVLTVPAVHQWPVAEKAMVTGLPERTSHCDELSRGLSIAEYPVLGCSLLRLDEKDRTCWIASKDGGYRIGYEIDRKFPFVLLFKPSWSESFSIEPYTYVTDAFNLPYPHELTGARAIEPGEKLNFRTKVWLELAEHHTY